MEPLSQRIKTFCLWGSAAGVAFFSVYPTTNYLTSLRPFSNTLCMDWELAIPFWPHWIWVYLSMYLLFVAPPFFLGCAALRRLGQQLVATTLAAGALFLLVPAKLAFVRIAPPEGILHGVYETLLAVDEPHNLIPSLHVTWSTAIALAIADRAPRAWSFIFILWAAAIALSTLLVHQHHLIDLVVAVVFVVIARKQIGEKCPC